MSKPSKTDLYIQRQQDKKYYQKMHIQPVFYKRLKTPNRTPREALRDLCSQFNQTVERKTGSNNYSVLLNLGTAEMAADYHYQFNAFERWCEDKGCSDFIYEGVPRQLFELASVIMPPTSTGFVVVKTDKLEEVVKELQSGVALNVLFYMKARCSRPNSPGGKTDLKVQTIADALEVNRTTITRALKKLADLGLVDDIGGVISDGKDVRKISRHVINI